MTVGKRVRYSPRYEFLQVEGMVDVMGICRRGQPQPKGRRVLPTSGRSIPQRPSVPDLTVGNQDAPTPSGAWRPR
jgi:hypothetical protein